MKKPELVLPTIQNWTCHNCGGCCRRHVIEITADEKARIEAQGWDAEPVTARKSLVISKNNTHRLAHQPDGACVFLDENGLCRIHAKFGEAAKPLACRMYPYAFHPSGDEVAVSLRFSCPSVVANRGRRVESQHAELARMAREVVPDDYAEMPPPEIGPGKRTSWDDFLQCIDMLDAIFAQQTPALVAVLRGLMVAELLDEASYDKLTGERLTEFLQLVAHSAIAAVSDIPMTTAPPRAVARRHLRMLVAQYAREDTMADADAGLRGYWNRLLTSLAFVRGRGQIPTVRDDIGSPAFESMEQPFAIREPESIDEILLRFFRVKIQGIHFCGPAYYHVPLVEGLRSLLLMWPAVMWISRWRAAAQSRQEIRTDDVAQALSIADHNHGYSEALGQKASRFRVRLLAQMNQIRPLCLWYSRTS